MIRRKVGGALLFGFALSVAATLLSGNLLHSLVPHEHGPNGTETASWGTLHAALQHGDKKVPLLPASLPLALGVLAPLVLLVLPRPRVSHIDALLLYVTRGIAPYRKFG